MIAVRWYSSWTCKASQQLGERALVSFVFLSLRYFLARNKKKTQRRITAVCLTRPSDLPDRTYGNNALPSSCKRISSLNTNLVSRESCKTIASFVLDSRVYRSLSLEEARHSPTLSSLIDEDSTVEFNRRRLSRENANLIFFFFFSLRKSQLSMGDYYFSLSSEYIYGLHRRLVISWPLCRRAMPVNIEHIEI